VIRSMTGFGHGHAEGEGFEVRVEARSVNNRSLRVSLRLPEELQALESSLEKRLREHISRGTVTVAVALDQPGGEPGYEINQGAIRYYRDAFAALTKELKLSEGITLSMLATLPGVIQKKSAPEGISADLRAAVIAAFDAALVALAKLREEEGVALWNDVAAHCNTVTTLLHRVESRAPEILEAYRQRLSARLEKLLAKVESEMTEEAFRREVALFADRSDVSEEIVRLRSHIDLVRGMESSDEPCGRRLEFVAQEMFREANTMAAKAGDPAMVQLVLDIKTTIEKIREQAMNVE